MCDGKIRVKIRFSLLNFLLYSHRLSFSSKEAETTKKAKKPEASRRSTRQSPCQKTTAEDLPSEGQDKKTGQIEEIEDNDELDSTLTESPSESDTPVKRLVF